MLGGVTGWEKPHIGGIIQSVTIAKIQENDHLAEIELGKRAIRNLITELETMDWLKRGSSRTETRAA